MVIVYTVKTINISRTSHTKEDNEISKTYTKFNIQINVQTGEPHSCRTHDRTDVQDCDVQKGVDIGADTSSDSMCNDNLLHAKRLHVTKE